MGGEWGGAALRRRPKYTMHNLVAFCGEMGTGKTTVAELLGAEYGHERVSLATPIKTIASLMQLPLGDRERSIHTYCQSILGIRVGKQFAEWVIDEFLPAGEVLTFKPKDKTGRKILQALGNNGRDIFGQYIWIDALLRRLDLDDGRYAVDDVRYPEEGIVLRDCDFVVVRLLTSFPERMRRLEIAYGELDIDSFTHISETNVSLVIPDVIVSCDGGPLEQYIAVKEELLYGTDTEVRLKEQTDHTA